MDDNFADADQDHVDRMFDDIAEAAKKPGFFDDERPESAGKWNDPGYWIERLGEERKQSAKESRHNPRWIVVSAYNFRRIASSFSRAFGGRAKPAPTHIGGLAIAVVPSEDDILEVR